MILLYNIYYYYYIIL